MARLSDLDKLNSPYGPQYKLLFAASDAHQLIETKRHVMTGVIEDIKRLSLSDGANLAQVLSRQLSKVNIHISTAAMSTPSYTVRTDTNGQKTVEATLVFDCDMDVFNTRPETGPSRLVARWYKEYPTGVKVILTEIVDGKTIKTPDDAQTRIKCDIAEIESILAKLSAEVEPWNSSLEAHLQHAIDSNRATRRIDQEDQERLNRNV